MALALAIFPVPKVATFKAWGYPLSPVLFIAVSVWMMYWAIQGRPLESALSLLTVILGGIIFAVSAAKNRKH